MITDNEIPAFLAEAFAQAPAGFFSHKQRQQAAYVSQFVNADLFGLYLLEKESHPLATLISQPKEEMLREYEYYRSQDPLFLYLLRQGGAIEGVALLGEEQWLRNPIGQLLKRWQMQYSLQGAVCIQGRVIGTLNFARAPQAGRYSTEDTLKVAALCREVSALLEDNDRLFQDMQERSRIKNAFVTSPRLEATTTLITDKQGNPQHPLPPDTDQLSLSFDDLKQIIIANIHSLESDAHQLAERTIFTNNQMHLVMTTLPLPQQQSGFITLIRKSDTEYSVAPQLQVVTKLHKFGDRTQTALDLLIRGYSNKLIAKEMGVSENTVKDHIRRIYRHYGVSNRTELTWRLGHH